DDRGSASASDENAGAIGDRAGESAVGESAVGESAVVDGYAGDGSVAERSADEGSVVERSARGFVAEASIADGFVVERSIPARTFAAGIVPESTAEGDTFGTGPASDAARSAGLAAVIGGGGARHSSTCGSERSTCENPPNGRFCRGGSGMCSNDGS